MKYALFILLIIVMSNGQAWGQQIGTGGLEQSPQAPADSLVIPIGPTVKKDIVDIITQINELRQQIDRYAHILYEQEVAKGNINWGELWYWDLAPGLSSIVIYKSQVKKE